MTFPPEYPNKPPAVHFLSQMFHPNIYTDGRICLDILQGEWSPVYNIGSILTSIQVLQAEPLIVVAHRSERELTREW